VLPVEFFLRTARAFPERIALESSASMLTYRALRERVEGLAAGLVAIDPEPQSRVAICARNNVEHVQALLATLAAGKTWVPLNPRSAAPEIARILDATEPSIVIADEDLQALVAGARGRVLLGRQSGAGASGGVRSADADVHALAERHRGGFAGPPAAPRDATQAIKFTGGTTGLPKGVMQPLRAWNANVMNTIAAWRFDRGERYLMAAPITHGTSTYVLPILAQGGCHVLPDETSPAGLLAAFRRFAPTACFMPPTLVYMLMAEAGAAPADFATLRHLLYGGAAMPVERIRAVRDFFGPVLETTYGQTEAPQVITVLPREDFADEANWASVGRASWLTEVAVRGPDGVFLPAGELGEVCVRGDLVMTGYWRLPERTAETIRDGWLHTGDRGVLDERGFLFLKDRLRDVVITGGFNVYPIDVENALGQHPAVHECAVFGVPDEKWGEAVHAAVQLRAGAAATEPELIAFVKERLGSVQAPKRVAILADLPRSAVGKVLRNEVRARVAGAQATRDGAGGGGGSSA
jgi:acyl-CoA synthetase (AMP-forming)/AMP-acid ligase II